MQNSLAGVLSRFPLYLHAIAIVSDIKKLYYQCLVDKTDQDFLQFLRHKNNDINEKMGPCRMTCLSFGLLCVQSSALFCLEKTLLDNVTSTSDFTIKTALLGFYVDDRLFSFSSEEELLTFYHEIIPLLNSRGFRLTKFVTNNSKLKSIIPKEDLVSVRNLNFETGKMTQNILRMVWNTSEDCFKFVCGFSKNKAEKLTRCVILLMYKKLKNDKCISRSVKGRSKNIITNFGKIWLNMFRTGRDTSFRLKNTLFHLKN